MLQFVSYDSSSNYLEKKEEFLPLYRCLSFGLPDNTFETKTSVTRFLWAFIDLNVIAEYMPCHNITHTKTTQSLQSQQTENQNGATCMLMHFSEKSKDWKSIIVIIDNCDKSLSPSPEIHPFFCQNQRRHVLPRILMIDRPNSPFNNWTWNKIIYELQIWSFADSI